MKNETITEDSKKASRSELIELLDQDLSREYQAMIVYVVYSQVLKGAEFMSIAGELEKHAAQELGHALIIAKQNDYLGGKPAVEAKTSKHRKGLLRCCCSISTMKRKQFEIIATLFVSARSLVNMPWASRFAKS